MLKCAEGYTSSLIINKTYGIKSLSQHFEQEIDWYVNIMWLFLTGKHLCWSLFVILSIAIFQSTYFEEHLQTATSEKVFIKIIYKEI